MESEIWKTIDEYPNIKVSSLGRVIKLANRTRGERLCSEFCKDKDGYYCVSVFSKFKNDYTQMRVNRLVALAFIPNPENKACVNHKDGNRINNTVENLEWVTPKENVWHSIKFGNRKIQRLVPRCSRLTEYQISLIDKLREFYTLKQISNLFNIEYQSIKNIVIRRNRSRRLDNQQPSLYNVDTVVEEGSTTIPNGSRD